MQVAQYNGLQPTDQKPSIIQLWLKFAAYGWLFLLTAVLAVAGAWLYLKYQAPLYEATATILVKDEKKGTEDSKILESLNALDTKKILENEIEVIQSRTLLNDVVKALFLYAPVYQKKGLRETLAYTTSPVRIEAEDPEDLAEVKAVPFRFNGATVTLNGQAYPLGKWVTTPYGDLKFNRNNKGPKTGNGQFQFDLINPKRVVQAIQGKLTVAPASKPSTVLNLKLLDEVPQRAEDVLNGLLALYNDEAVKDKNSLAASTLAFIDKRLADVGHDLDSIENSIRNYKAQNSAVDIGTQGKLFLENVSSNDQRMSEVNMQLAVLDQVEKSIASKEGAGIRIAPSTLGVNDPVLPGLLNKLYDSELEYEKLKTTQGQNNPVLTSLANQIETLRPSILQNIRNQKQSLESNHATLAATNNKYTALLRGMPQKERDLLNINRSQNIRNDIYNFLLQKKEEASLSYVATVPDSRTINKAEASLNPVSPKAGLIYVVALVLALFVTVCVVTVRDLFNSKILFRSEIEQLTAYPVVGEITYRKKQPAFVIGSGHKTPVAEQFRKLRLAIEFPAKGNKKIAVTSTIAGEGKSFIASNLALSLALAGKKVALLELDLNNPSLTKRLGFSPSEAGITTFLEGDHEPEEIILRTKTHENLFFIPAGRLSDNPTELLMNGRLQHLFRFLEPVFDYIVVDTAPVGPVTDACLVSPHCDATIYVVRHKYTPKALIGKLDASNKINRLKNPLIVFNAVDVSGFGRYAYGNGYDYGYYNKSQKRLKHA